MPTYSYHCSACDENFDRVLPMSQYDSKQTCSNCGAEARKLVARVNFNLPGDDWASKNGRVARERAKKNEVLKSKSETKKREQPGVKLVPNVGGERVESWSDAQKLASSKGKDTKSYEPMVRKEQGNKS